MEAGTLPKNLGPKKILGIFKWLNKDFQEAQREIYEAQERKLEAQGRIYNLEC